MNSPDYVYPTGTIDQPQALLEMLGTHWSRTYAGFQLVQDILFSRAQAERQQRINSAEAQQLISRHSMPVFHTDQWYSLQLLQSEMATGTAGPRFDEGLSFGSGIQFGGSLPNLYSFPLPDTMAAVPLLFNRMTAPSLSWVEGLDYVVDYQQHTITFLTNPFQDSRLPAMPIHEGLAITDQVITLWACRAKEDLDYIYQYFGFVVGVELPSSENYKQLTNAVWDGLLKGSNTASLEQLLSAVCDIPIAQTTGEVVQSVGLDSEYLLVITDQWVYRFPQGASAVVRVGDTLQAGQQLTDVVTLYSFNQGQVPNDLASITLGDNFLLEGLAGGVTFPNQMVPVTVTPDQQGFTRIDFPLGGRPSDVQQFFDELQSRGVAAGYTLANLLDSRTNKVGQPTAQVLPSTINPLVFLAQNVLRSSVWVVRIKTTLLGDHALPLSILRAALRRLLPPQVAVLLLLDMLAPQDNWSLASTVTETPLVQPSFTMLLETYSLTARVLENPRLNYTLPLCR